MDTLLSSGQHQSKFRGSERNSEKSPGGSTTLSTPTPSKTIKGAGNLNIEKEKETTPSFLLGIVGRIETGELFGVDDVFVKFCFVYGPDWQILQGVSDGVGQITEKNYEGKFVWNLPFELTLKSTNPHGWPQIVVCVYGSDCFGNQIVHGYGVTHVPITNGPASKSVPLFVPESSSFLQKLSAWIVGRYPEFVDPKIIGQGEGRQVIRVKSNGEISIKFEVIMKDFQRLGYKNKSESD